MNEVPISWWVGFNLFILAMLALDLGVFNRKAHVVSFREGVIWTVVWICLALLFNTGVYFVMGGEKGAEFLAGYLVEKSLSVDNVFVFSVIFTFFAVPREFQHRVLFWGVLGALVMRAFMIFAGVSLISRFAWVLYIFAALLFVMGVKMLIGGDKEVNPEKNPALILLRKVMPVSSTYSGQQFFVRTDGRWMASPLFAVVICIEFSDLIFAIDSLPAIFSITQDAFIIYTSNVFAILGLRSLYFALVGLLPYFHFLKYGLGFILCFVGIKMAVAHTAWKIETMTSLMVIVAVLTLSILASIIHKVVKTPPLSE